MDAKQPDRRFTAEELSELAQIKPRTLRYYIQLRLIDPPIGETRAAYYTCRHLNQLLRVREYSDQGFALERIGEILRREAKAPIATVAPRAGSITVHSRVHLADGVELVVEPGRARLSPEQLRRFAREAIAAYARIATDHED